MNTPAIAHFGTTIIEAAPADDCDQRDVPITGELADMLQFLSVLGFEPQMDNMYPGMGRQYIWSRGQPEDVDYLEQDNFTSYAATDRPATDGPRVGDTIFRLPHKDPRGAFELLNRQQLVEVVQPEALAGWQAGATDYLLVRAPNRQLYELGPSQPATAENHVIYVWTADDDLIQTAHAYQQHFGLEDAGDQAFHGLGRARLLRRAQPGVTIGLLYDSATPLAERWTDDIFVEAGYSHFRIGALDKAATQAAVREAFPGASDVAFVYFADSYLELVQA